MKWRSWSLLLLLAAVGGGTLLLYGTVLYRSSIAASAFTAQNETATKEKAVQIEAPLITFLDPVRGAADGDVTIVEYGNYGCLYCRELEKDMNLLLAEAPSRVRLIWKDLPSDLHPGSDLAAEAALCAKDQGKFWPYHDLLFGDDVSFDQIQLTFLANDLELDLTRFNQCLGAGEKKPVVARTISEAEGLGIGSIPYLFINGQRHSGQLSYEELKAAALQ